jgi:phosphoserine phosphatase
MSNCVVFDFDKTLTKKDTLLDFFKFCGKKDVFYFLKVPIYFMLMVFAKLKIIDNLALKNCGIKLFLSNFSENQLAEIAVEYSQTIQLSAVYYGEFLKKYNQPTTIISSASFALYIKPLFPNNIVVASEILFVDGRPEKVLFNCYGDEKRMKIEKSGIHNIDILFTDNISDLPLVKIANNIFLVKNDTIIKCRTEKEFLKKV